MVSQGLTKLQNELRSLSPSVAQAPDLLVHLSRGGNVEQSNLATSIFTQFLSADIGVRNGENWDGGSGPQKLDSQEGRI